MIASAGQLRGFETLERETVLEALPVSGEFPAWLHGSLYRNGPAKFEVGKDRYRHWFDGLAMLHRFTISDGSVSYANRYLGSAGYNEALRSGRIVYGEFATKPRLGPLEQLRRLGRDSVSQNANVNVLHWNGELLAVTETPTPMAFDAVTLETCGPRPYDDDLGAQTISAHPHYDPERKRAFNLATEFGRKSTYHIVEIAEGTRNRRVIGSLSAEHPSYLHTFGLTQRYAILVEYPFVLGNALDLALGRRAFIDNYRWQPERGTRFHAMRLDDGTIAHTWEGEAFFAFHHINAFDDGDAIVLDVSAYRDAAIVDDFRLERVLRGDARYAPARFRRYRLDPKRGTAEYETVAEVAAELPRVAARARARRYEYAHGVASLPDAPDALTTTIVKVRVDDGALTTWSQPDQYPGEPVFVERPGATAEDDGVVLSVVLDAVAGTSYLLALDASNYREIARAAVPHHIPFGFHGAFVAAGN